MDVGLLVRVERQRGAARGAEVADGGPRSRGVARAHVQRAVEKVVVDDERVTVGRQARIRQGDPRRRRPRHRDWLAAPPGHLERVHDGRVEHDAGAGQRVVAGQEALARGVGEDGHVAGVLPGATDRRAARRADREEERRGDGVLGVRQRDEAVPIGAGGDAELARRGAASKQGIDQQRARDRRGGRRAAARRERRLEHGRRRFVVAVEGRVWALEERQCSCPWALVRPPRRRRPVRWRRGRVVLARVSWSGPPLEPPPRATTSSAVVATLHVVDSVHEAPYSRRAPVPRVPQKARRPLVQSRAPYPRHPSTFGREGPARVADSSEGQAPGDLG